MSKTNVNIRMDKELKEQAEKLFADLGLNMTSAFNIFASQAVRQGSIPFEITLNPPYNKETIEAMEDVKNNKNLSQSFNSVDELMRDLDA